MIPPRPKDSQKGKNGHVLLVAGSQGMAGAAILAGLGALKAGAGLLTIALPESIRRTVANRLPEAMTIRPSEITSCVHRRSITTLAVGPGLGMGTPQKKLVLALLRMKLPIVVDADALNNIRPGDLKDSPVVITPHPGELSRLLGKSINEIQKNRVRIASETARRLSLICVLKGHQTVITDGERTFLNTTGNQAMATGGMGDVLTGIIAGLLAQGLFAFEAACAGVYLHGLAGDMARVSDRGLLASDLAAKVPNALRKTGIR
jgi:NAD(P)H-hydrate epimerase